MLLQQQNSCQSMNTQPICPKCQQTYTHQNPPKQLINCEHIICLSCLNSQILCPIDRKRIEKRKYKIQNFQTSHAILHLIVNQVTSSKQEPNNQQPKEEHVDVQNSKQQQQSQPIIQQKVEQPVFQNKCNISTSKPVQQVTPSKLQDIKFQKCLLHSKNADLICLKDKCLICSNCGLFGQHKNHSLLGYDQFILKFTTLMEQSYNHFVQLKKYEQEIAQQKIVQEITSLIKQKRQTQIKNLKRFIAGLVNFIKSTQKLIINQIDQTLQDRKQSILKSLNNNVHQTQINHYYKEMELMSQGTIDIFKLEKIDKYIDYVDQNHPKSCINKQGQNIISQIDRYSKRIRAQIKEQINGFQCKFNTNLNALIANSIEVKSKNQDKLDKAPLPISMRKQTRINSPLSLKKGRQQDLLINSKSNSEKKGKLVRDMSPIQPIPRFEQTFDTTFKNSYKQRIITQGKEDIFLQVKEVTLTNGLYVPHHKKTGSTTKGLINNMSTHRQQDPKKDIQNINHIRFQAKANSNNSSHIVQREILSVLNQNKKKKKIDLPEKYTKIYDQLHKDRLDVLDLGGAFLGDQTILSISQLFESRNKLKSVKLMNNKISDDIFPQIMSRCRNLSSINLSYNNLSEKSLEWLQRQAQNLGSLCNITISNNKIVLRNVKDRIEQLRKKGIKVSL